MKLALLAIGLLGLGIAGMAIKMFFGKGTEADFLTLFNKNHSGEKFLFPCSDIRKPSIPDYFAKLGYDFSECIIQCIIM